MTDQNRMADFQKKDAGLTAFQLQVMAFDLETQKITSTEPVSHSGSGDLALSMYQPSQSQLGCQVVIKCKYNHSNPFSCFYPVSVTVLESNFIDPGPYFTLTENKLDFHCDYGWRT